MLQGQSECTNTGIRHPANKHKPVFLKELSKVWDNPKGLLKWEPKFFGPQNTVLLDDSPYKGLKNPVREGSKEIDIAIQGNRGGGEGDVIVQIQGVKYEE